MIEKVDEHISVADLEIDGITNFIASYIVRGEKTAIIETGPSRCTQRFLDALAEADVNPRDVEFVIVSHIHLDHAGASGHVLPHLPRAKLVVHPRGAPHMVNPEKLWQSSLKVLGTLAEFYGELKPVPEERILVASDGMRLNLGGGVELTVVETQGHATHHISIYDHKSRGIFTGDSAGIYIPQLDMLVPTTPPPFHVERALASLEKMEKLNPKRLYYSHFGPHNDAIKMLNEYRKQIVELSQLAEKKVESGSDLDQIVKEILEESPLCRKVMEKLPQHPFIGGMMHRNIEGFVRYHQWIREERK